MNKDDGAALRELKERVKELEYQVEAARPERLYARSLRSLRPPAWLGWEWLR